MKKHIFLGVNTKTNVCCILYCLLPFDMLVPDEIEKSDFGYDCTGWNGCDNIERTLSHLNRTRTGNVITLNTPIDVHGIDSDMGHEYRWTFEFTEIHETKELTPNG